jgi:hypothetical protein
MKNDTGKVKFQASSVVKSTIEDRPGKLPSFVNLLRQKHYGDPESTTEGGQIPGLNGTAIARTEPRRPDATLSGYRALGRLSQGSSLLATLG